MTLSEDEQPGSEVSGRSGRSPTAAGGDTGTHHDQKLSERKLKRWQKKYNKRGVIYISRIPPHMKPQKLRHLLSAHGEIGRLYLAPEDAALRKKRKQHGGNTGKNFTEGWVEFEDKAVAKQVVAMLNGNPVGGKHRSAYYSDLWAMKYLPKFKWDNLTEEIAYQNAIREQKLAAEISAAKRERDFYLGRVDRSKANSAMADRKRKRQAAAELSDTPAAAASLGGAATVGDPAPPAVEAKAPPATESEAQPKRLRAYGQRRAKADPVTDHSAPTLGSDMLSLIAGKRKHRASQHQ